MRSSLLATLIQNKRRLMLLRTDQVERNQTMENSVWYMRSSEIAATILNTGNQARTLKAPSTWAILLSTLDPGIRSPWLAVLSPNVQSCVAAEMFRASSSRVLRIASQICSTQRLRSRDLDKQSFSEVMSTLGAEDPAPISKCRGDHSLAKLESHLER